MAIRETGNADPTPTGDTKSLPPDQPRGGRESMSDREAAEALTQAFGIEGDPEPPESGTLDEFFSDVRKEVAERNPSPASETARVEDDGFVHEPTGKRFKTELELLRYDSGFNNDKLGQQNKALREELDTLKNQLGQAKQNPNYNPTRDDIKQALWPSRSSKELSEDAAADFVMEAVSNALQLQQGQIQQLLAERDGQIAKLNATLEEMGARAQHRVEASVERRFIDQYPGLAKLPAAERVAVIAGLAETQKATEQVASPKLSAKIPALKASDHVESSAASSGTADSEIDEDALMARFSKIDDPRKELAILGELVRRQRGFAGYEVDY